MTTINPVAHSPLTATDITRLPSSAMVNPQVITPEMAQDQFVKPEKKTSFLTKAVITLLAVAAGAAAIKKWKPNWLNIDANAPKWTDHIKKAADKVADWTFKGIDYVKWPFQKVASWFSKKPA